MFSKYILSYFIMTYLWLLLMLTFNMLPWWIQDNVYFYSTNSNNRVMSYSILCCYEFLFLTEILFSFTDLFQSFYFLLLFFVCFLSEKFNGCCVYVFTITVLRPPMAGRPSMWNLHKVLIIIDGSSTPNKNGKVAIGTGEEKQYFLSKQKLGEAKWWWWLNSI